MNTSRNKKYISAIILASGFAHRFKEDKLLARWQNETILLHTLRQVIFSNVDEIILVVQEKNISLCNEYKKRFMPLTDKRLNIIANPNPQDGMSKSLKLGLDNCSSKTNTLLFHLIDQVFFTTEDINILCREYKKGKKSILAPYHKNQRKNPILLDFSIYKKELLSIEGDIGARQVVQKYQDEIYPINFDDEHKFVDIDTKEEYISYKKQVFSWENILKIYKNIAIIGAGGKTSLMWNIAKEVEEKNIPAIFTTSTKVWNTLPQNMKLILNNSDKLEIKDKNKLYFLASSINKEDKLVGLETNTLSTIIDNTANTNFIIEADGAKGKIFKFYNKQEPCIPKATNLIIIVLNIDILNRYFSDKNTHRVELEEIADKKCTLKTLLSILNSSKGYFAKAKSNENLKDIPFILFINGVEKKQDYKNAMTLISTIQEENTVFTKNLIAFIYGSNKYNYYEIIKK